MNEQPRLNIPEWTVSELSAALRKTVEDAFGYVRVRGEISGYRGPHSSGHCYFALKDEGAKIEAVIWRTAFGRMRLKPEEGLEVIVTGRLTTYPGQSKYQIVIETLEPAGLGALMALLEERKKKLAAEGLFDAARKQLLPFLPERDRRRHLADRRGHPRHPASARRPLPAPRARVAGARAGRRLGRGGRRRHPRLQRACADGRDPRPDLLIVARGGGSLEDLWSFNEEIVVRAAAASMIPLISAVGHETDVTLIDFAADVRAPTPTAAAEMAVPVRAELLRARSTAWRGARSPAGSAARRRGAPSCARRSAPCPRPRSCSRCRGSGSISAARACRARSSPMRRFITRSSRASPAGSARRSCARA